MNAVTPRKDERGGSSGPSSDRKNRRNVSSNDDGWSTATSNRNRTGFSIQSDKLKNRAVSTISFFIVIPQSQLHVTISKVNVLLCTLCLSFFFTE